MPWLSMPRLSASINTSAQVLASFAGTCVDIIRIATPSSRRRGDGVEVDATIQRERAVKF